MTTSLHLMLIASVVLSALAQITLKAGMSASAVQGVLERAPALEILAAVASSPGIIAGVILSIASIALWLGVLARIEVSRAYPFFGLGFLLTMAFGCLVLGETLNSQKAAGTMMVVLGVYLVARA